MVVVVEVVLVLVFDKETQPTFKVGGTVVESVRIVIVTVAVRLVEAAAVPLVVTFG